MNEKIYKDKSYGMISVGRVTGGGKNGLFGSSINHTSTISMKIGHGSLTRDLNSDWFHMEDRLIEIEMSTLQFSELITSLNVGAGIPCTIKFTKEDGCINYKPLDDIVSTFKKEVNKKLSTVSRAMDGIDSKVAELLKKNTINKNERLELLDMLTTITGTLRGRNIGFTADMFDEQIVKTMSEAKCEFEGFVLHRLTELGLEHLKNEFVRTIELKEDKETIINIVD